MAGQIPNNLLPVVDLSTGKCDDVTHSITPQTTGDPYLWGPLLGLLLIAIGTGGIKPCVAAFGGDQFGKDQAAEVAVFFSIFYFSINCGSLLSTFVTPILREDIQCFDNDCYALAFGVPAILLFVAIIIFIVGRYTVEYKMYPPQGNIVWLVCKTIGRALKNKSKYGKEKKYDHWLDYASDKYDAQLIKDTKILLHVLIMYIPLPVFWALFDQQGSRWTLQATQMNGNLGSFAIKPDQMQVLNPLLILLLIPIFDSIIYPCLRYCKIRCTHLQRMSWGMLFASVAFVCSALVQLAVNETVRVPPTNSESGLTLINAAPCDVVLESPGGQFEPISAPYTEFGEYVLTEPGAVFVDIKGNCSKTSAGLDLNLDKGKAFRVIAATFQENNGDKKLEAIQAEDKHEKPDRGLAYGSLVFTQLSSDRDYYKVELRGGGFTIELNATKEGNFFLTDWYEFEPATYSVHWNVQDDIMEEWTDTIKMESGAVYSVVFQKSQSDETIMVTHETVPANSVSILFQIPQYVIITTGEVMFSITGLEFSYAQAPASMKSCLQACWLLTVAGGNLIVILIAGATFISNQAYEFLFFAGLMLLVFFIFVGMSVCYTYVSPSHYDDFEEDEKKQKLGNGVEADEEKDPNAFAMTNPMDTTEGEK
ncbi:solute carrier family 15 member 2-like isoform X1 [Ptychodera flava]|uniref:solute carrier family 15 member 2-like isoform X1 n=1 Tax=Ptychodera flava TaxID=63121 RepID=UPI00396A8D8C